VCGADAAEDFQTPHHRVARCQRRACGHLFAVDTKPGQGVMHEGSVPGTDYGVYRKRDAVLVKYWLRKGFLRDGCRLLDVGSGSGHILAAVREQVDVEIHAVEASESHHNGLSELGCRVCRSFDDVPTDIEFDACTMIEVIEHTDDPTSMLRAVRSKLTRGGRVFLTTPGGDYRLDPDDPTRLGTYGMAGHVQFFTPRSLRFAFRKAGFRRVLYRYVMEMSPDDDMEESDYVSLWAKRTALQAYVRFLFCGARHLTYFAM